MVDEAFTMIAHHRTELTQVEAEMAYYQELIDQLQAKKDRLEAGIGSYQSYIDTVHQGES